MFYIIEGTINSFRIEIIRYVSRSGFRVSSRSGLQSVVPSTHSSCSLLLDFNFFYILMQSVAFDF